jgi:pyrroloquinoline quinone (PQQ) biosynthesis protein C
VSSTNWHLPDSVGRQLSEDQLAILQSIIWAYDQHRGYRHPIWDWIGEGTFDLHAIQVFASLYYAHVRQFRKYLAGAITVSDQEELQSSLADILAEEYGRKFNRAAGANGPSHPELYRRFMRSIDVDPDDWEAVRPIAGIEHFNTVHFDMFRNGEEIEIAGAVIFGMESTTPYRHTKVDEGLRQFSRNAKRAVDGLFFSRHVEVDPRHGQSLLNSVHFWLNEPDAVRRLIDGTVRSLDAREVFLDDLQAHLTSAL